MARFVGDRRKFLFRKGEFDILLFAPAFYPLISSGYGHVSFRLIRPFLITFFDVLFFAPKRVAVFACEEEPTFSVFAFVKASISLALTTFGTRPHIHILEYG